jgi:hypothetical protein
VSPLRNECSEISLERSGEAVQTAIYLINRMSLRVVNFSTPP